MTEEQLKVHQKYQKIVRVLFIINAMLLIAAGISLVM